MGCQAYFLIFFTPPPRPFCDRYPKAFAGQEKCLLGVLSHPHLPKGQVGFLTAHLKKFINWIKEYGAG